MTKNPQSLQEIAIESFQRSFSYAEMVERIS